MSANPAIGGNEGPSPVGKLTEAHSIIPSPDSVQLPANDPETIRKLAWFSEEADRALATSQDQAQSVVEYARKCGEFLNRAKDHLPHGEFQKWLQQNFKGSARTAHNYRRLASNWQSIADLPFESVASAIALIRFGDSPPEEVNLEQAGHEKRTPAEDDGANAASGRGESCWEADSVAPLIARDGDAQTLPSSESLRASGNKAAAVIVLLKKHLKAGPTEAIREELREVQEFCRQELSKLGSAIESEPGAPPISGSL
ncbi:DUF3102 domain-containing protein [Luteolibacter sp. GHJ8]|uniref:DUF3102 domain-containing protein n=1 Tax=Luteolibacter rhizosphaerae TaxID=2989719 RepID=A0ABT3GAN0_9BACT|nr:DUF3102 domain-containing protein [Luteolibacter rhizosphaerae]MCW1916902.1 DUF3102 domain-containing protein [Luteolibacter rhizosphaerae]